MARNGPLSGRESGTAIAIEHDGAQSSAASEAIAAGPSAAREGQDRDPGDSPQQPARIVRVERLEDRQHWLTYSNNWY
jgi:hypothetical protein